MDKDSSPPFRRRARNVWVMTQHCTRLPEDAVQAKRVCAALDEAIRAFQQVTLQHGAQLRLITGVAEGIDAKAAEIARKYGCAWHVVTPDWPGAADGRAAQPDGVALIMEKPGEFAPAAAAEAADEAKLGFADAVVVVCDGAPLRNYSAERDGILVEALCRHTPIVWIEVSEDGAGAAWILRPQALDELAVTTLAKDPEQVRRVGSFFSRVELNELAAGVTELLAIHWNVDTTVAIDAMLRSGYGDPGRTATLHGWFYTAFLWFFGNWSVKTLSPVQAQRGPPALVRASQFPADTWEWFDRIDRASTYAAYSHRDQVVLVNLVSSLAVLAAVAGQVWIDGGAGLSALELGLLGVIYCVVRQNRRRPVTNHDRWLHFRQSAEALRLSALLHPLLASLPLLHRGVWKYDATQTMQPVLGKPFHWLVIQLLRDAGIPGQGRPHCIETQFHGLLESLDALIGDQETYHERSTNRYEQTHRRLRSIIVKLFGCVVVAVGFHLCVELDWMPVRVLRAIGAVSGPHDEVHHHLHWPLLLTAFLPALGAAMHGIASKAELQRLAKNSERMRQRLSMLRRSIEGVRRRADPMGLRALALETAVTMYAEHDAWAELMSDQPLELV
jgi:hypothetical protein